MRPTHNIDALIGRVGALKPIQESLPKTVNNAGRITVKEAKNQEMKERLKARLSISNGR